MVNGVILLMNLKIFGKNLHLLSGGSIRMRFVPYSSHQVILK